MPRMAVGATMLGLACAGCALGPAPAEVEVYSMQVAPDDAACRVYRANVKEENDAFRIEGRACPRPDGSWTASEGRLGGPRGEFTFKPTTGAWLETWHIGPPVGISLGRPVIMVNFGNAQPWGGSR